VGAVNVKFERVFVAKSWILPLLGSRDVASEIPSVSTSARAVWTTYVNVRVRVLVPET
jgi:hypothetical protein